MRGQRRREHCGRHACPGAIPTPPHSAGAGPRGRGDRGRGGVQGRSSRPGGGRQRECPFLGSGPGGAMVLPLVTSFNLDLLTTSSVTFGKWGGGWKPRAGGGMQKFGGRSGPGALRVGHCQAPCSNERQFSRNALWGVTWLLSHPVDGETGSERSGGGVRPAERKPPVPPASAPRGPRNGRRGRSGSA